MEWPRLYVTAIVKKYNKRLVIQYLETGEILYTPPDFIRVKMHSREPLVKLARKMSETPYENIIDHIMEFEKGYSDV